MSNASFYNIPEAAGVEMARAMDKAAKYFYSYPDEEWQLGFEADWLFLQGFLEASAKADRALEEIRG